MRRVGCEVKFAVTLDHNTSNWYVSEFEDVHNHQLADEEEVCHLRSHRKIISLHVVGIRKRQIMDVLENKEGGFHNAGFIMKDMYNFLAKHRNSITYNGDAEYVLQCMKLRKENDAEFFYAYNTDENGRLTTLFWTDAQSRLDYQSFGDVLIFDSTYRMNRYNMPFIPFVGVNHHRSTTIFGCGIVKNERAESYKWLLSTLLTAMYQNKPKSVMTDGCPSMAKAIREILPRATHHICAWHVDMNMVRHLHTSNHEGFRNLLYNSSDPREFESRWNDFINSGSTSLRDNAWLKMMYSSRDRWAEAYFENKLFLGMISSQRSESLNNRLHRQISSSMCLFDLVRKYDRCVSRIRRNEVQFDCKASQSIPVTKTEFVGLEKYAAHIYTPNVFFRVQDELARSKNYEIVNIDEDGVKKWYILKLIGNTGRTVVVECVGGDLVKNMKCFCMKMESEKIPCRHILRVSIDMRIDVIPQCCLWERWTKSPKPSLPLPTRNFAPDYGEMTSVPLGVYDPEVVVGRGAPKKRFRMFNERGTRRCTHCRQQWHNRATCPELPEN